MASSHSVRVVSSLDEIADDFDIVGVDMPIGLPCSTRRSADSEARAFLRPRGSTVFPTPPRALLEHDTYVDANAQSKARFGVGLTRQSFLLFPKIREVDTFVRARPADSVVEIHPECAFARMAGKPLSSKHFPEGRTEREALLRVHLDVGITPLRGAKTDDVLDAYAVLWSALRFARGTHVAFGDGAIDECGLPMRIVS